MNKITAKAPKGIFFWLFFVLVLIMLWNMLSNVSSSKTKELTFSEFMDKVENDQISSARIASNVISGDMNLEDGSDYTRYESTIPVDYPDLINRLRQHKVNIAVEKLNKNEWLGILLSWAPFVILIGFWMMIMRQQGGNKAFSFGKSKARLFTGDRNKFTFKDVAGVEEAKDELEEIIEFLKEPKKFQRLGGKIPKGVLLIGPPGTGKTLLAKAIAGEANVPFFSISGSDFVELFVGVGASRVRDLFDEGKKHAPCLIFIDEIDAVGRQRGTGLGGGHDEREQTLNQLLVEMDGFDANEGVIIIAATNRPDILDSALLRPGRFDRRIVVSTPDVKGREEILKVHTRNTPLAKDVDLPVLARSTPGFTGADIANMVNEAALYASRNGKKNIAMEDFEYAKDKVLMGSERKSMIISEEEKRITAYHEAGHALIAALEKEADPLHKVSIIPRGMALGVTQQLPLNDKYTYSKTYLDAQLSVLLAGRISEETFLNMLTTGAGNDFEKATSIARKMVCEWGMSAMGPMTYAKKEDMVFLGRDLMSHNEYSEETSQQIDKEIKKVIDQAYANSKRIILDNRDKLEIIALQLLEKESLTSDDIAAILGTPQKPDPLQPKKRKPRNGAPPPEAK
ncbi:MAG: ATP-dependent zinc metalloprotease FtsH [Acidobacteriota bacterium]|nr:ATP-dependent zinc metalloprotease FtsH [Acidobacteriota bacterium]